MWEPVAGQIAEVNVLALVAEQYAGGKKISLQVQSVGIIGAVNYSSNDDFKSFWPVLVLTTATGETFSSYPSGM